jgi:hypothetical protein
MYMKDWIEKLDDILKMNKRELLTHAGKISHQAAPEKSEAEYEKFIENRRLAEKENSMKELEEDIKKIDVKKLK